MSSFDSDKFMDQEVTDSMATSMAPIPEGEYQAFIMDIESDDWKETKGDNPRPYVTLKYNVIDEVLKQQLDRETVIVRDNLFLDFTSDGQLDTGDDKNIRLGALREALGFNAPGEAFSLRRLSGAGPLTIRVTQSADKNDPTKIYSNVSRVAPPK